MEDWLERLHGLGTGGAPYCLWLFLAALIFFAPLEKRGHWKLRAAGCALAFALAGWLLPSTRWLNDLPAEILWYLCAWLLICLQCFFICRISAEEALFCGINAMLTEHIGSSAQILLTARLFQGHMEALNSLSMLVYLPVYAVIYLSFGRKLAQGRRHLRPDRLNVAVVTVAGLTATVVLSLLVKVNVDPDLVFELADAHAIALVETGQLYAVFFCASLLALQYAQQRERITRDELAAVHELWSVRQKQYEMSRETIDAINRKCHDMKHQIAALMAEGGTGDPKRARYAQEVERLIKIYDLQVNTQNEALNTLLMERGLYCSSRGIRWDCAVDGESLDFMDDMDLYVLLGNALDNAVEAVLRVPEADGRIIQLRIGRKDSFVHIRLENSFAGEIQWRDGLPVTSKEDATNHGIGLKSIRDIARKYGGDLAAKAEGGAFLLNLLIPIPSASKPGAAPLEDRTPTTDKGE